MDPIYSIISRLFEKLKNAGFQTSDISPHSLASLNRYRTESVFFSKAYSHLLKKVLARLRKPVYESTFIDYGGGCGILSLLAKEAGFRTVIYIDKFRWTVNDARNIASHLKVSIDQFICGEAEEVVNAVRKNNYEAPMICSFDVIEHIYNPEHWIETISKIEVFMVFFHTSANPAHPIIRRRLKKIHRIAEYEGCRDNIWTGNEYISNSFLKQREIIIREKFPGLEENEIKILARETRGLTSEGIADVVTHFMDTGMILYKMDHSTNTCDPYTGNWAERLIDLDHFSHFIKMLGLSVRITNTPYCYSGKKVHNIFKYILNQIMKVSGPELLTVSPSITIEIEKWRNC